MNDWAKKVFQFLKHVCYKKDSYKSMTNANEGAFNYSFAQRDISHYLSTICRKEKTQRKASLR